MLLHNMNASEIKQIFTRYSNDIAFLIGNGINLYYRNDNLSWKYLLLYLWGKYSSDKQTIIPDGISFTEFYDALEIQNAEKANFSSTLQKEVKNKMINWHPNCSQNLILNRIKEMNAPILTTNFDDLIQRWMVLGSQTTILDLAITVIEN